MAKPQSDLRTPSPMSKRSRESSRPGSSDQLGGGLPIPAVKVPSYLNQDRLEIHKHFQELEWQQRFRIQHGHSNPDSSPFRLDKSEVVVDRNRYGNVQPWESSRIRLNTPIGGSDYINASPISLKSRSSTPTNSESPSQMLYIATQGPKDDQFAHFWHMVMQETVGPIGIIVMLTQLFEGPKEKCSQYFPKDMSSAVLTLPAHEGETQQPPGDPFFVAEVARAGADGSFTDPTQTSNGHNTKSGSVTLLEMHYDEVSRSEVRKLRLEIGTERKEIHHYLFNGWPDYTKPEGEDRRALLQLIKQTTNLASPSNPRFVHCSAGVGRTGTFIAIDFLLSELERGNLVHEEPPPPQQQQQNGDQSATPPSTWGKSGPQRERESTPEMVGRDDYIFEVVNKLREQRMMMVMNDVQYAFLYEVVKEAFVEKHARVPTVGVVAAKEEKMRDERDAPSAKAVKTDKDPDAEVGETGPGEDALLPVEGDDGDEGEANVSEAETEINESVPGASQQSSGTADESAAVDEESDPYAAVAPEGIREEIDGKAADAGAE